MLQRKAFSPHKSVDCGLPCRSCCRQVFQSWTQPACMQGNREIRLVVLEEREWTKTMQAGTTCDNCPMKVLTKKRIITEVWIWRMGSRYMRQPWIPDKLVISKACLDVVGCISGWCWRAVAWGHTVATTLGFNTQTSLSFAWKVLQLTFPKKS